MWPRGEIAVRDDRGSAVPAVGRVVAPLVSWPTIWVLAFRSNVAARVDHERIADAGGRLGVGQGLRVLDRGGAELVEQRIDEVRRGPGVVAISDLEFAQVHGGAAGVAVDATRCAASAAGGGTWARIRGFRRRS